MAIDVEATYEDGMLKPDRPLPLEEHQRAKVVVEQEVRHARRTYGVTGWPTVRKTVHFCECHAEMSK